MFLIRAATSDDLPELRELYLAAMRGLHALGVSQWTEEYPVSLLPEDIERRELFILEQEGMTCAAIALNDRADSWHAGVPWTQAEAWYVHRLAVHPKFQGKGFARELMTWAHGYAAARGAAWMHLDTNRDNLRAVALYKSMGYRPVSEVEEYGGFYVCLEMDLGATP